MPPKEDPPAPVSSDEEEHSSSSDEDEASSEEQQQGGSEEAAVQNSDDPPPPTKTGNESEREAKRQRRAEEEEDGGGKGAEEGPRAMFQRLWPESDEITLLRGLIKFADKQRADPFNDLQNFHGSIKPSLTVEYSYSQFKEKINRLKKKFKNHAKGKHGLNKTFSKGHDQLTFDLSKKIWNSDGAVLLCRDGKSKGKAKETDHLGAADGGNDKAENEIVEIDDDDRNGGLSIKWRLAVQDFAANKGAADGHGHAKSSNKAENGNGHLTIEEFVMKKGLEIMQVSKRNEFVARWKELEIATLELGVRRHQLMVDQARAILEEHGRLNKD